MKISCLHVIWESLHDFEKIRCSRPRPKDFMAESNFLVKKCYFAILLIFDLWVPRNRHQIFFITKLVQGSFSGVFRRFWAINEHLGPSGWFCRSDFVFSAFWHFGAKYSVHVWLKMLKSPKSTCPTSDHHEKKSGDIWISFRGATRKNNLLSQLVWSVGSI